MAEKESLQHMVRRFAHDPCAGIVVCAPATRHPVGVDRGALGGDLCQPHALHGRSISSRTTLARMAEHLSVGRAAWAFVGRLEACRVWLCVDCAWGGACICFAWFAAQFECLDKLADCSCPVAGILCARANWTLPPRARSITHPGLAAVFSACHPADRGFEFHSFSCSRSNE